MILRLYRRGLRTVLLSTCRHRPSPLRLFHPHSSLVPQSAPLSTIRPPPAIKEATTSSIMLSREEKIEVAIAEIEAEKKVALSEKKEALAETRVEDREAVAARHDARVLILERRIDSLYQDLRVERQRLETERQHHRLVESAFAASASSASTMTQGTVADVSVVFEARKKRWEGINAVLDAKPKARIKPTGQPSTAYFMYLNWKEVKDFFPIKVGEFKSTGSTELSEDKLLALYRYLSFALTCLYVVDGKEAMRVHFIAPILIMVCAHFNGDVALLVEEDVNGSRVHAHGHFEFVMKRGGKRLCIVEAKKDDFVQGMAQSLVGCEALCDVEELPVTYCIVTNFMEWYFLKDEADKVTMELVNLQFDNPLRPSMESLRLIANKIIAILD